jgi:hypothetical protein
LAADEAARECQRLAETVQPASCERGGEVVAERLDWISRANEWAAYATESRNRAAHHATLSRQYRRAASRPWETFAPVTDCAIGTRSSDQAEQGRFAAGRIRASNPHDDDPGRFAYPQTVRVASDR